jgi:3-dehydroquinate synthase
LSDNGLVAVPIGIPQGEEAKTAQVTDALYRQLAVQECHRDDVIVALGGGATGDVAGFVAATYMRGVAVVQIPTTLTAQVDASIGGKTGVNLPEGKNLVGTFYQPTVVLADVGAIATLPDRDFRSGLAEVAKYGLTLDLALLKMLETDPAPVLARDASALEDLVATCIGVKARAVVADERDVGDRLILNYGHTLGHALERLDAYAGRSHGEAITAGMLFAARLAEAEGVAPAGLSARHTRLFNSLGLESESALPAADDILAAMRLDKKYHDGGLRFVLLEEAGRPKVVEGISEDRLRDVLRREGEREL